jgi:Zn-dependent membrane protease YugP
MQLLLIILLILLFLGIVFIPQVWLTRTLKKYHQPADKFPGTGGQFAVHLLKQLGINEVNVEATQSGDHYDPRQKMVRLGEDNFNNKSLTAIVVAAHEVGHAIQHKSRYRLFRLRQALAVLAIFAEKTGIIIFMIMPVLTLVSRAPIVGIMATAAAVALMSIGVLVHLITLPVEWDASFRRALPLLEAGEYLDTEDYPAARKILKAAAFTYLAGALSSLLNLSRWIAILRR